MLDDKSTYCKEVWLEATSIKTLTTMPTEEDPPFFVRLLPGYGNRGSMYVVNLEL